MPKTRAASAALDLVARAPFGMFRVAADGIILEANPAMAHLLGHQAPDALRGQDLGRAVLADPADLPRLLAAFEAGSAEPVQSIWRRHDLSLVVVRVTARPLTLPAGGRAFDCWTEDVDRYGYAEARFLALIEHNVDIIALFAPDGRVLWSSPGAVRVLGYEPSETVGWDLSRFLHPDDRAAAMQVFAGVAAAPDHTVRASFRAMHRDGTPRHIEAVAVNRLAHPAIRAIVVTFWDVTERVRAEEALRRSEAYYRAILEQAADAIFILDADGRVVTTNQRALEMFGYTPEEIRAVGVRQTYVPEERDQVASRLERLARGETLQYERLALHKNGTAFPVEITARMVSDGRIQSVMRDVSARRRLEAQLRQSSKMEAVGQLAGGVAHDFNNLLTAILGSCGFLLDDPALSAEQRRDVEEIQNAARRAASLTRQLLAFSRKQVLQPELLRLNDVVTGLEPLLRRLLGEHIAIRTALAPDLPAVTIDKSQLEQVIINLGVNARDAMPKGGTLTIATEQAQLDDGYVERHPDARVGRYTVLVVSDDGIGMDAATQARIYEPFFTTKAPGFGTGLGLSTVYGIVQQSQGHVAVYSEPGHGTTFRIYLPPAAGAQASRAAARRSAEGPVRRGTETVLLVEDEARVRGLARRVLEGLGYRVLEAGDGREALALGEEYRAAIHLLFTDVVMPGMGGREVAERLALVHPEMRVLYTSGYAGDGIVGGGVLAPELAYLGKPYSAEALGRKVGEVLASAPAGEA